MKENNIIINNLHKNFGNHVVLDGINLEIESGSSFVILGGSGSGKSVLIKAIIGIIKPSSGNIFIKDIDTTKMNKNQTELVMKKCGFLFQSGALFDSLTVKDNILFFARRLFKMSDSELRDLAEGKLRDVGLSGRVLDLYPSELSGGMQKRVALARTIATNPEIIFFDEPTTGLDPIMSNVINDLIIDIKEKLGATCIIITHDMNSALKISDQLAMLYEGKIIWKGTSEELKNTSHPVVKQFINGYTKGPVKI